MRRMPVSTTVVVVFLGLGAGCKGDDGQKDSGVADRGLREGGKTEGLKIDQPPVKPDGGPSKKPKITKIIPDSGPANGGSTGQIPVTLVGENFAAGMAVYIDGELVHTPITVSNPTSASFAMPKNPYGAPSYDKPQKVQVGVLVGTTEFSNQVDFQYTVAVPMTATFKGAVTTASSAAYRDFPSDPIAGKVLVDLAGTDAGAPLPTKAQVGLGPAGSDPTKDSGWQWWPATATGQKDGSYDLYSGTVVPWLEQKFDVAYRFSIDGGGRWIYADTDDTDLKYDPAKAATLAATKAPLGFCLTNQDCVVNPLEVTCKVDPANKANNKCVECLKETDCSGYVDSTSKLVKALGPKCESTKYLCYCAADADCAKNQNGAVCIKSGTYCGCTKDTNCQGGMKCYQDQNTGMTTCK